MFRSRYEITFVDHNGVGKTVVTEKNATRINVTNLVPGSIYEFTVVNVYRVGSVISKSEPSQPVQCNTTRLGKHAKIFSCDYLAHLEMYLVQILSKLSHQVEC